MIWYIIQSHQKIAVEINNNNNDADNNNIIDNHVLAFILKAISINNLFFKKVSNCEIFDI